MEGHIARVAEAQHLHLASVHNFRDCLAGLTTTTGKKLRTGAVYRCANPCTVSEEDAQLLAVERGISSAVDLRSSSERGRRSRTGKPLGHMRQYLGMDDAAEGAEEGAGEGAGGGGGGEEDAAAVVVVEGIGYVPSALLTRGFKVGLLCRLSLVGAVAALYHWAWRKDAAAALKVVMEDCFPARAPPCAPLTAAFPPRLLADLARECGGDPPGSAERRADDSGEGEALAMLYFSMMQHAGKEIARALRSLLQCAERGCPAMFFCSAGKDRTGIMAMLVQSICGVRPCDICAAYAATELCLPVHSPGHREGFRKAGLDPALFGMAPARAMACLLHFVASEWGSPPSYLASHCGFSFSEQSRLATALTVE